jgi:hypothetical protein
MKYKTHRDKDIDISGTFYVASIDTTYQELVEIFGLPCSEKDSEKTKASWCFEFEDGTIATIYDYKDEHDKVEDVTDWHVGGHNDEAYLKILKILEEK